MQVRGNYARDGYAAVEALIPAEVAAALLAQLKADLEAGGAVTRFAAMAPITRRTAFDVYVADYPPMAQFLWGLTPAMEALTGRPLLPTYNYFRLYRRNDICRVHSDREACEHSLSLTLGYSDNQVWPFEVGTEPVDESGRICDDFEDAPFTSIAMQPGDAVLYRGVTHRHGRLTPNPNRWSAHMFLHFVDRDGPHKAHAFDGRTTTAANFEI